MKVSEKIKTWVAKNSYRLFIGVNAALIACIFIYDKTMILFIIERAKIILGFWFIIFVVIFLPRRLIILTKSFRRLVLYIKRYHTKLLVFRLTRWWLDWYDVLQFSLNYIQYKILRVLYYCFVGTKVVWLSPYRKNWQRNEFIILVIMEGFRWIHYIIIYIIKVIYEVIIFFDTATIFTIIQHRVVGFLIITNGYIIVGGNFVYYYIIGLLLGFAIYNGRRIYLSYKATKLHNWDTLKLIDVLVWQGFEYTTSNLDMYISLHLREQTCLCDKVLKLKNPLLLTVKKKYGAKKATEYMLCLRVKLIVEEKSLISLKFFPNRKSGESKIIWVAKTKFATKFWNKLEWLEPINLDLVDNFEVVMNEVQNDYENLFYFQWVFLYDWGVSYMRKETEVYMESFFKHMPNYYEFNDMIKFVKYMQKKIELEGGKDAFYKKYYEDRQVLERYVIYEKKRINNEITRLEAEVYRFTIIYFLIWEDMGYKIRGNELEELIEQKYKKVLIDENINVKSR